LEPYDNPFWGKSKPAERERERERREEREEKKSH
jgi:hypothetical protein